MTPAAAVDLCHRLLHHFGWSVGEARFELPNRSGYWQVDASRDGHVVIATAHSQAMARWECGRLETRVPIPATEEHPELADYEYERKGTASIFMFAEPLSGFRQATARPHRTKVDWAHEVAQLLDTRYAKTPRITLLCDNLNTHTMGAFYEAFPPAKAREYVRRINFVYTPKHGSWLNVAECELSCLTSQCLSDRRIADILILQAEIAAWADRTNAKQRAVDWQFTIAKARIKLKRLYPAI